MRAIRILLIALALLSAGLMAGASLSIGAAADQVEVWKTDLYGDPAALEGLEVEVVNCRKVKPLPDRMLEKYARLPIVTLEENAALGGFGAQVAVRCAQLGLGARVLPLGIPDAFIPHGTRAQQLAGCGLDVEGICRALRRLLGADNPKDAQEVGKD